MQKAIFLYNDGRTLLPKYFGNEAVYTQHHESGLFFHLKELEASGYKIIQLLPKLRAAKDRMEDGVREITYGSLSNKLSISISEVYFPQSKVYDFHTAIQLLNYARGIWDLDLSNSWFIGNKLDLIEAANLLDLFTVILDNGEEKDWLFGPNRTPIFLERNIHNAIKNIKKQSVHLLQ